MVAKKDLKQYRKSKLISEGFLPFEAEHYSNFPLSHAGMRRIRRFRQSEIKRAIKAGIPKTAIPNYISTSYKAKGYIDDTGKLDVNMYGYAATSELEKHFTKRKNILITPDRYENFRKAVGAKWNVPQALKLAENIPPDEWEKRQEQYRQLINNFYLPNEAFYIVTAQTPPDKDGQAKLQHLDLTLEGWQKHIQDRLNYVNEELVRLKRTGVTKSQALKIIRREIQNWYDADNRRTPFDDFDEIYPNIPPKADIDEIRALQNRRARQIKKRMPYRQRKGTK